VIEHARRCELLLDRQCVAERAERRISAHDLRDIATDLIDLRPRFVEDDRVEFERQDDRDDRNDAEEEERVETRDPPSQRPKPHRVTS
jgi:hypothetical protein